jgi:hypothetical protein
MLGFSPFGASAFGATADGGSVSVSVNVTGVSATGGLGGAGPIQDYNGAIAGNPIGSLPIAASNLAVLPVSINVPVTGVSGAGAVGVVQPYFLDFQGTFSGAPFSTLPFSANNFATGTTSVNVNVTGVQAAGQTGTVTVRGKANTSVTGVIGSALLDPVGVAVGDSVEPAGFQHDVLLGQETVTAAANVLVTGVQAAGQVGTVRIGVSEYVDGVQGNGQVGTVAVSGDVSVSVIGVHGDTLLNTPTQIQVNAGANAYPSGVQAQGVLGEEDEVIGDATVYPTGVVGSGLLNSVGIGGEGNVTLAGVQAVVELGEEESRAGANAYVTGVQATSNLNTVTIVIRIKCNVFPIGVQAQGIASRALVWGPIPDNPGTTWNNITNPNTATWTQIVDGNTVQWVQIPT